MQQSFWNDNPKGYVQVAGAGAAITLASLIFPNPSANAQTSAANTTAGIPNGSQMVILQCEGTGPCRLRDDGIVPTASVGYPMAAGAEIRYAGGLPNLQIFIPTGTTLNVWMQG